MDDLISRTELKERLMHMARFRANSEIGEPRCGATRRTMFHMSEIVRTVNELPTIEERKTGNWGDDGDYVCSVCGFECDDPYYLGSADYCPNCGAKMKGETK